MLMWRLMLRGTITLALNPNPNPNQNPTLILTAILNPRKIPSPSSSPTALALALASSRLYGDGAAQLCLRQGFHMGRSAVGQGLGLRPALRLGLRLGLHHMCQQIKQS